MSHWRISFLLLAALFSLGAPASAQPAQPAVVEAERAVYIIPIRGMIEPALLYVIRRGLAEAETAQAEAIIFVMDTPGGTLQAASEIVRTLQKVSVPTYTFVEKDAFSAGAIIAMATDKIYMAPGSVIGDAMPIMMSPMGGAPQPLPEDVQEKMVSAVAALIRSAAQESGHDPQLAEKMVRRNIEYRIGDVVISPTNQLLTLTNVEAERKFGEDQKPLLSSGTVKDVEEMLEREGRAGAVQKEMAVTTAERIARYIAAIAPILFAAGLLGIYIEVKSPGLGLPGILGGLCLVLFFWGHHIAGLAGMEEVLIFVLGLALLLVEVLFFPSAGLLGLAGTLIMLWAILTAMVQRFPGAPALPSMPDLERPFMNLSLGIVLAAAAAVVAGRFLPKTTAFARIALATSTSRAAGYSAAPPMEELVGLEGIAASALRPSGLGQFADRQLDVMTAGEFIAPGTPIRIVQATGSHVVVEAKKEV